MFDRFACNASWQWCMIVVYEVKSVGVVVFWVFGNFVRVLIASEVSVSFDPGKNYVKVGVVKKFPNIVVPKSEAISV